MPILLRIGPYKFYIYASDCAEPRHVHVDGGSGGAGKVWLEPVEVATAGSYRKRELERIVALVRQNQATLIRRWDEECARPD